ncbi:uncharacterized protein K02A2.6-like [Tachysurus ichikawai]
MLSLDFAAVEVHCLAGLMDGFEFYGSQEAADQPLWPKCPCVPCKFAGHPEGQEVPIECSEYNIKPSDLLIMNLCWTEIKRKSHNIRKHGIMFVGHHVTDDGMSPDPDKIRAMGMVKYLGKSLPHVGSYIHSIIDLLSGKNEWCWGAPQQEAFQRLKTELSTPHVLAHSQNLCSN